MSAFEKIEYRPRPVREILVEMKNLSELMIDLAYSAALFHDKELADEVVRLENRVDTLTYLLDMNVMIAARSADDAEALVGVSVVASAADKISDAAADIAVIVLRDICVHPIVREAFEKVEERLGCVKVESKSVLVGKTLGELGLEAKIGVDVIAIRRGENWIINPKSDETIEDEDFLIVRGAPGGMMELGLVEGSLKKSREPTIAVTKPFRKIVDKLAELKDTSELMMDLAYSSLLLNSRELAEEVQMLEEHIDSLHTEFELLVLASIPNPQESKDFLGLIRLGVVTEKIADAAAQIAAVVLRGLEPHPVLKLVIEEAAETVSRVSVSKTSSIVGKTLRQAQIPEQTGMWILAMRRAKKWIRPKPDSIIKAGDILIASGYAEGEEDLQRIAST